MQFEQPGCFGFVATYNVKSRVCQACTSNQACAIKAKESLASLAAKINVDAVARLMQQETPAVQLKRPVAKKEPAPVKQRSPLEEKILAGMSAHAARSAAALLDAGVNHRVSLLQGVNSMRGRKPITLEVLFDLLLEGPVTRLGFVEALKQRLGYTHNTASSQASIGFTAVLGLGIARETQEGSIVIRGDK